MEEASPAIGSDAPSPNNFDAQGKVIPGLSPEYTAWAKAHKLTIEAADDLYAHRFRSLLLLGATRDSRAIPFLRQALLSPNFLFEALAARDLAELQDKASIPLIIDACQRAPADVARGIAVDLLKFNDPQAQTAAEQYLPKDVVQKILVETETVNKL